MAFKMTVYTFLLLCVNGHKATDEITVIANFVAIKYLWCTVLSHSLSADVFSEKSRRVATTCLTIKLCHLN
jgi:hypothetical protein